MPIDYAIRLSAEDNLSGTLDNIQDQLDKTGMSAKKLDDIKKSFTAITTSSSSLKKKVADLRKNMLELAAGGKQNSELYEQMAATARTYQTAIDKVRKDTRGPSWTWGRYVPARGHYFRHRRCHNGHRRYGDRDV